MKEILLKLGTHSVRCVDVRSGHLAAGQWLVVLIDGKDVEVRITDIKIIRHETYYFAEL